MAELYDYEADDGTVYEGLSITDALKLKQEDEERAKRQKELQEQQASDAKLGPQISAGIHAYEARKFQGQPQQPQLAMSSAGPAPAVSIQGMSDGGNIQPVSGSSQFEGTPAFDSISSNPSSISGMVNNNSFRSPPSNQERAASASFMALTEGIPEELTNDLIARYRMGELKPSAFVKEVIAIKKTLNDDKRAKEKEDYLSKNRMAEDKNKAFFDTEDKLLELDSQERRNRENIASAERMNREDNATLLETSKNKGNNPNDIFGREYKLRSQYNQLSKEYNIIRTSFKKLEVAAERKDAPGDMALIYQFMRQQDPTSTVREGEFATAEQARGIPQSVVAMYNKAIKGTRLDDKQRNEFLSTARQQYDVAEKDHQELNQQYREIAQMYQLDPDRIMGGTVQPGQGAGGDGSAGTGTQINQPIKVGKYTIKKVQ